jgi:hypothetical protein
MITPTIGRVVLLHLDPAIVYPTSTQPCPGLITFVHNDRQINVGGFDANGTPVSACMIPLLQDDDPIPESGTYAFWMPYQIQAAAAAATPPAA